LEKGQITKTFNSLNVLEGNICFIINTVNHFAQLIVIIFNIVLNI